MRRKPRIYKLDENWVVELPPFGFHEATVHTGFPSWNAAGRWLRQISIGASDGTLVEIKSTGRRIILHEQYPLIFLNSSMFSVEIFLLLVGQILPDKKAAPPLPKQGGSL
jgi:hypothetical protein